MAKTYTVLGFLNPWSVVLVDSIESIYKKVMLALRHSVTIDADFQLSSYDERRALIGLDRLSDRRRLARVFFLYDVLTSKVDAPDLSIMGNSCRNVSLVRPSCRAFFWTRPLIIGLSK